MLDEAGWTNCKISASNSLDEYIIRDLSRQGARIDLYGVGERLITSSSTPYFGGVYKLVAVENDDGTITPKIKVSENVDKITVPHFKKVYRLFNRESGKAEADYICLRDESLDGVTQIELFDPFATWKRNTYRDFIAKELLEPVFLNGELVTKERPLKEIQGYCQRQVDSLWDEVKRFDNPHHYYVDLSQTLWDIQQDLLQNRK